MPVVGPRFLHPTTSPPFDPLSLTQFFNENSDGRFTLYGDEFGYVSSLDENDYFNGTTFGFRMGQLVGEAMEALQAQGVNFADYDADGNGWLDHIFVSIRGFNGRPLNGIACGGAVNNLCASGVSNLGFSEINTNRFGIKIDNDLSGNVNQFQVIDPLRDNSVIFAHEIGHDIWPGSQPILGFPGNSHLMPIPGNGLPQLGSSNPDMRVGHGLMISTEAQGGRVAESVITSAAERFHTNAGGPSADQWISCVMPTGGQTYTMIDGGQNDSCIRLPLGIVGGETRNLFLSNIQRTSTFNASVTAPVNPGSTACNTCIDAEWGLPTTGLMIELTSDVSSTFNGRWRRDIVTADNTLTNFSNNPICDLAAGVGLTLEQQFGGDLWRPGIDRQLTPWTRPNVYGYTFLSAVPTSSRQTGLHAIDNIRAGSGSDIVFDYHAQYNQRPVAYVRENWWIAGEIADLAFNDLRVQSGATLTISSATTFNGNLIVEAGGTLTVTPGTTLSFAAGKGIVVEGTMTATGATLRAVTPAAGWSGLTVQGTGSAQVQLLADTRVQHVGSTTMWGSGAVRVFSGVLTLDNARIQDPAGLGSIYGILASGPWARVRMRNNSLIRGFPLGGMYAGNSAWVQARDSDVTESGGHGVQAFMATVWALNLNVAQHSGWGALTSSGGHVTLLSSLDGVPISQGENTEMIGNGSGDLHASGGTITAGAASEWRRNSFESLTQQVRVTGSASAVLRANWWGQSTGPDLARVTVAPGSSFEYCPWVTAPAGPLYAGSCASSTVERMAGANSGFATLRGAGGDADPLGPALTPLDAADAPGVFAAVTAVLDSLDATAPDTVIAARAVPVVVAALRVESLPGGLDLLERLTLVGAGAARSGAFPSGLAARMRALGAFSEGIDAGRDAALALAAGGSTAPTGQALLALVALASGDTEAATAAVEAAERALTSRHAPDDHAFVAAVRADVSAATGQRGDAALEPGTLEPVEELGGRMTTLDAPRPNPTAGRSVLALALIGASDVDAALYDGLGRRVALLASGRLGAGVHDLSVDAAGLPAGLYVVRVRVEGATGTETVSRRVVVAR